MKIFVTFCQKYLVISKKSSIFAAKFDSRKLTNESVSNKFKV